MQLREMMALFLGGRRICRRPIVLITHADVAVLEPFSGVAFTKG